MPTDPTYTFKVILVGLSNLNNPPHELTKDRGVLNSFTDEFFPEVNNFLDIELTQFDTQLPGPDAEDPFWMTFEILQVSGTVNVDLEVLATIDPTVLPLNQDEIDLIQRVFIPE